MFIVDDFPKIHMALLKGRAAIVNNDMATLKTQATFIHTAMEKAIAGAALGYLGKWKTAGSTPKRTTARGSTIISAEFLWIRSDRYTNLGGMDRNGETPA